MGIHADSGVNLDAADENQKPEPVARKGKGRWSLVRRDKCCGIQLSVIREVGVL